MITSYLGGGRVIDLDSAIIEKAHLKMVENGGISSHGMRKVHMELLQIMCKAYLEESIERNPCDAVESIKRPKPD